MKTVLRQLLSILVLAGSGLFCVPGKATEVQPADEQPAVADAAEHEQTPEAGAQQSRRTSNQDDFRPEPNREDAATDTVMERASPKVVEEIVVTGSRIRRDAFTSALPVTIITTEDSTLAGLANTSEVLQTSALASGSQIDNTYGGAVVSGGPGVNTFGLRSLDPGRTLILVNGRRFTPAGARGQVNSVDLNSIPDIAINRIEILKDGASSIYGADAVAGVVNIITRKGFDGFTVKGYYQDELDFGSASGLYGRTWDRGHVDVGVEVSEFGPVGRDEQDWSFCDERPLTNGGVHPSYYGPTRNGRCFGTVNGYVDVFGVGAPFTLIRDPGADLNGTGLPWRRFSRRDGARVVEEGLRDDRNWTEEHLIPERRRIQVYSDGSLDFDLGGALGTVSGNYEFYYNRREDSFHGGYNHFFPFVHFDNPTNPFGRFDVTAQPSVMDYNMLNPVREVKNDVTAVRLGLEGGLGGFSWKLDGGYSWSRAEWTYDTLLKDRVARSLSAGRGADGSLHCVLDPRQLLTAANYERAVPERILAQGPDPDCIPLDLFSEAALSRGEIPAEAADYISERVKLETDYDLWSAGFSLEGRVFDMPAGEARAVLGMDWRSRSLHDRPPPASVEDNQWNFSGAGITRGDDRVIEGYMEVEAPLLSGFKLGDISLAEELTVNGSYRYTHYSSYGSDSTWRLLFNYAVNPALRLRTALGTSFRAPALYHLNLGDQTSYLAGRTDPCSEFRNANSGPGPGSNVYRNCAALESRGIIPPGFASEDIVRIHGGNPGLEAETSNSWTLGFIVTPDLAGRFPALGVDLGLAFDYYNIDIENSIARQSPRNIVFRCYNSPGLTAEECGLLGARREDGVLSSINTSFVNVAVEKSSGYDITAHAEREFPFGDLSVDVLAARLLSYEYGLGNGKPANLAGLHANASWRGEAAARFRWRDFTLAWYADYIGSTRERPIYDQFGDGTATNVTRAGARFFHNLSVRYRDSKGRFYLVVGVRNIFDEPPPVVGWDRYSPSSGTRVDYNIPLGAGYDLYGRRVFATFKYNFSSPF